MEWATGRLPATSVGRARLYFALQAVAGTIWWVSVFASDQVRERTLGDWDPALLVVPDMLLFVAASAVVATTSNRYAAVVVAVWTTAVTAALAAYGLIEQAAGWGVVAMAAATAGAVGAAATIWFGTLPVRWFFVGPFAFKVATESTSTGHLRRSLTQLVAFWTTFFLAVPLILTVVEDRLRLSWAPLGSNTWTAVGFAGAGVWNLFIRPTEEADLAERFGDSYRHYAGQVQCWIPRVRPAPDV